MLFLSLEPTIEASIRIFRVDLEITPKVEFKVKLKVTIGYAIKTLKLLSETFFIKMPFFEVDPEIISIQILTPIFDP